MMRRAFTVLASVSLFLWALCALLWPASYFGPRLILVEQNTARVTAMFSQRGVAGFWHNTGTAASPPWFCGWTDQYWVGWDATHYGLGGPWEFWSDPRSYGFDVPWWALFLAMAVLPAAWVARYGPPRWVRRVAAYLGPFAVLALARLTIRDGRVPSAMYVFGIAAIMAGLVLVVRDYHRRRAILRPLPWQWRARRRAERLRRGLCLSCGYDLRASEGRCPECGTERRLISLPDTLA